MQETPPQPEEPSAADPETDRRTLFSNVVMGGGLLTGYGAFAAIATRFLYPARPTATTWQYVARVNDLAPGSAMRYRLPSGARVNIARSGSAGTADDFIALSSVCPHLGCQVHWEGHRSRFFCPCHNAVFDKEGDVVSGPPPRPLDRYEVKVEEDQMFILAG